MYTNNHTKVPIICPEHGVFWQRPYSHLNGIGCPICGNISKGTSQKDTLDNFVIKAKQVHGNTYDYTETVYENASTSVNIICSKHGSFYQTPARHLSGRGCPKCGLERNKQPRITNDVFLSRAIIVHGDKYQYPEPYNGMLGKLKIICPDHGEFYQGAGSHLHGRGCPLCAKTKQGPEKHTFETFLKRAREVHGNVYQYDSESFKTMLDPMEIVCSKHGIFYQLPRDHINRQGHGCPRCCHQISKGEIEIYDWLISEGFNVQKQFKHSVLGKESIDVYLPDFKVGIEYNGLYVHSTKYSSDARNRHLDKLNLCNTLGIRLLQLWDEEWKTKQEICKEIILFMLGRMQRRLYAKAVCNSRNRRYEVKRFSGRKSHSGKM